MSDTHSFPWNACLLQLLLGPVLLGALCIGESIVNYFHAREAVTLLGIFFFSLVLGFLAALILFGILHACWLNSYVEREVKQEFRERFCYTIFGCVLVLCSLITFFGCFGEVVGKTWDNMDIGVRNDEWASVETLKEEKPKKQSTEHEASRATSPSSKDTHSDTSSTSSHISSSYSPSIPSILTSPSTNNGAKYGYDSSSLNAPSRVWNPGDAEKAFDSQIGHVRREKLRQSQSEKKYGSTTSSSGYKSSDVFDAISNYRPSRSSSSDTRSAVSSETNTEAAPQAKEEQKTIPVSERITDSDWECADGCEQEDFWITEEDDETHNSSCPRYGEGEGLYSAQGSGTDCTECGGAK